MNSQDFDNDKVSVFSRVELYITYLKLNKL